MKIKVKEKGKDKEFEISSKELVKNFFIARILYGAIVFGVLMIIFLIFYVLMMLETL